MEKVKRETIPDVPEALKETVQAAEIQEDVIPAAEVPKVLLPQDADRKEAVTWMTGLWMHRMRNWILTDIECHCAAL